MRGNMMRGRGMVRGRPFRGAGPPMRGFMGRGARRGFSPSKSPPHGPRDRHFNDDYDVLLKPPGIVRRR